MLLEYQIPFVSFIFILMLNIVYFSKKKVKLVENIPYYWILVCSLIASSIDTVLHIISANCNAIELINFYPLARISNKILSSLFVIIFTALLDYILLISYEKNKKEPKKRIPLIIFDIFSIILLFSLKVEIIEATTARNVVGSTIITGYIIVGVLLTITTIINLINFKKQDKRYWALFLILFLIIILYFFTIIFPGIIIYDLILALMCYVMYFTIENPDVKMLNEITLAKNELEKANRVKSEFISSMSHEIRTPLNAIVGFSELAKYAETLEEAKENSEDIINASNDLLNMMNKMFQVFSLESESSDIENESYDPQSEFAKILNLYEDRISKKGIKLEKKIDVSMPFLIGDKDLINKAVINVLDNAYEYTETGTITFTAKYEKEELIIIIEDTGIGIKEKELKNIFTPFKKSSDTKNTSYSGMGLGLSITKSLIDKLNGNIKLESIYKNGTKVEIRIKQEECSK